jgi:formylmethanofuran dehydrogenase subunit E
VFNGGYGCSGCSGNIPWTYDRVIERIKDRELDKMFDFSNVTKEHIINGCYSKIPLTCLTCDYNWTRSISHLFNHKSGCPECYGNTPWTYERVIERIKDRELDKIFDFSQVTKEHITNGQYSKIPLTCLTCDYNWTRSISYLFNHKSGCPNCSGNVPWTYERLIEEIKDPDLNKLFDFSKVTKEHIKGCDSKIPLVCLTCKYNWISTINNVFNKGRGCPMCKNKSERKFKEYFEIAYSNYSIECQYSPKWCINQKTGYRMRYDFLITTNKNINIIIEVDGVQHLKYIPHFHRNGEEDLEIQRERDNQKMVYSLENNISLIRILQEDVWRDKNEWKDGLDKIINLILTESIVEPKIHYVGGYLNDVNIIRL